MPKAIRAATGLPLEIKWPNDVVTPGPAAPRAGASSPACSPKARPPAEGLQHVILGIGINISPAAYPPELADRASSIETELGRAVEPGVVLAEVLAALATELDAARPRRRVGAAGALAPAGAVGDRRRRRVRHARAGAPRGIAAGIADDGALLVRVGNRVERVIAGEVVWKQG